MRFYLATNNAHKVEEFRLLAAAAGPVLTIASARMLGGMPAVAENTGSFVGNARQKAAALRRALPDGSWALADDSGLCVAALDGAPGVDSAIYAGPQADAAANLAKLVDAMQAVPAGGRGASFVCVLAVVNGQGEERIFEGRCEGRLLAEPAGAGGFGYDPLFVPAGESRSFAELSEAEKNRISHRARAWAKLVAWGCSTI